MVISEKVINLENKTRIYPNSETGKKERQFCKQVVIVYIVIQLFMQVIDVFKNFTYIVGNS
jgi:hypothetical protein